MDTKNSIRFQMFCSYLDELQAIKGLPQQSPIEIHELYSEVTLDKNTTWIDVFEDPPGNNPVGFLIIGTPPNCHPEADYYIEEAYIKPNFRHKKLMTKTVSDFIQNHIGTYCLFIINRNDAAHRFWLYVFGKMGYIPCHLPDVGAGDEYCTQFGFRPSAQH